MAAVKKFYDTNDIELKWQKSSLMLIRERGGGVIFTQNKKFGKG